MAKNVSQSPLEKNSLSSIDQKLAMAKRCSHVAGAAYFIVADKTVLATARRNSFNKTLTLRHDFIDVDFNSRRILCNSL
ncbi:hypothetical protein GH714_016178 [Hevea brasiliensis]|uniref:Uncharacterized protein n=1 Tax=Hevea brasiliensis TaxID=3981 RepID=A0A6A6ME67_HEVBR|nr:hypothetical protein GH714_016178 [Hevea brasiliensis]